MKKVVAISRVKSLAILTGDEVIPITNWMDEDGECDKDDAIMFVAGPCSDEKWYTDEVSNFTSTKLN